MWRVWIALILLPGCDSSSVTIAAPAGVNSTGLAIGTGTDIAVSGSRFAFRVNEGQQFNNSLNDAVGATDQADTDANDKVVFLFNVETQFSTNLTRAGSEPGNLHFLEDFLVFTVDEAAEGATDLNEDGDVSDHVLFFFDVIRGSTLNTTHAVLPQTVTGDDEVIAFELPSGNVGWIRINTPSALFDSGVALIGSPVAGVDLQVGNGFILFLDASGIPKVIDTLSASDPASLGGGLAARQGSLHLTGTKAVYLQSEGATAKNGDSDTSDYFPAVSDLATEVLGISSTTVLDEESDITQFRVDGNRVAFLRPEADSGASGTDHNGDGDVVDKVLYWFSTDSATTVNATSLAGKELVLSNPYLAVSVPEVEQEGSTASTEGDLNGDGDIGLDRIVLLLDTTTAPASITNLRMDGEGLTIGEEILVFGTNEFLQNDDLDRNGSIDGGALVSQGVDLLSGETTNLGWQADQVVAVGRRAFFRLPEGQYLVGDGNRDGDEQDSVVGAFALGDASGWISDGSALRAGFFGVAVSDSLFVFPQEEGDIGRDLNGDQDLHDRIIRFLKF